LQNTGGRRGKGPMPLVFPSGEEKKRKGVGNTRGLRKGNGLPDPAHCGEVKKKGRVGKDG